MRAAAAQESRELGLRKYRTARRWALKAAAVREESTVIVFARPGGAIFSATTVWTASMWTWPMDVGDEAGVGMAEGTGVECGGSRRRFLIVKKKQVSSSPLSCEDVGR